MMNLEDSTDTKTDQTSEALPLSEADHVSDKEPAEIEDHHIVLTKDENSALLERVFQRILETSMSDVPICNDKLKVEAIAYGPVETEWLGVLVTPWCMNFMLLCTEETEGWDVKRTGLKFNHIFPAGRFEFISGKDDELGPYRMCSLFSPMFQFGDHNSAMQTAALSLKTLMDATEGEDISEQEKEMNMIWRGEYPEEPQEAVDDEADLDSEDDLSASSTIEESTPREPVELSRRDFLRGGNNKDTEAATITSTGNE